MTHIRVGIIMGSASDLPIMKEATDVLANAGIGVETTVASAHRTPDRAIDYAKTAESRGLAVIIAGAGGAAHLPGVIAALTPLPVIGVPIKSAAFNGLDSLLSIVQMPAGVPVATVGVDAGKNAGLLALRILGIADDKARQAVKAEAKKSEEKALAGAKEVEGATKAR